MTNNQKNQAGTMTDLSGRCVIITGGGTGIGAAIAGTLADAGCDVTIAGRRKEKLDEVIAASGSDRISAQATDVTDRDSVASLFESVISRTGRLDILINCAGINIPERATANVGGEDWDRVIAINATGAFNCLKAALPTMRKRGDGVIVNISSIAGKRAIPLGGVAYNASKFAMTALGTSVGEEEKENGIRVTNIYPGEVETPILENRPAPVSAERRSKMLQPDDVAAAVRMVCELPPRARVPELVIVPTVQTFI